jgi:hypothetical protein
MAVARVKNSQAGQRQKIHAGRYVHDEAFNEDRHDLTAWIETPASSRVSGFRYDHMNQALQVSWRNNSNHGYIYLDVPYESFRTRCFQGQVRQQHAQRLRLPADDS